MTRLKSRLVAAERANPVAEVHAWRSPPGAEAEVCVLTHLEVYAQMHQHCVASLPNETGGFLLGRVAHDPVRGAWHIEIDESVPVVPLSQDPVHFAFSWRDVDRVRSHRESQAKALVGWYHTHPDMAIFLSETDLDKTHRVLFSEPFQVALVYDPVGRRAGYFFWEGAQIIDASSAPWREFELAFSDAPADAVAAEAQEAVATADASGATDGVAAADLPETADAVDLDLPLNIPAPSPAAPCEDAVETAPAAEATAPESDSTGSQP